MPKPEPKDTGIPILFLVDTSGLSDDQIDSLFKGLHFFKSELDNDAIAEIAVVTFSGTVTIEQEFTPINSWEPPSLGSNTDSRSPMGEGIKKAAKLTDDHRWDIRNSGLTGGIPQILLIASNRPTDMDVGDKKWDKIQDILEEGHSHQFSEFIISGASGSRLDLLNELVSETDIPLLHIHGDGDLFHDYFRLISEVVPNRIEAEYDWDRAIDIAPRPNDPVTFRRPIENFDIIPDSDSLSLY